MNGREGVGGWQETLVGQKRELFMVGREGVEAGRKLQLCLTGNCFWMAGKE